SFCFSGNIVSNLDGQSLRHALLGLFGRSSRKKRARKVAPGGRVTIPGAPPRQSVVAPEPAPRPSPVADEARPTPAPASRPPPPPRRPRPGRPRPPPPPKRAHGTLLGPAPMRRSGEIGRASHDEPVRLSRIPADETPRPLRASSEDLLRDRDREKDKDKDK